MADISSSFFTCLKMIKYTIFKSEAYTYFTIKLLVNFANEILCSKGSNNKKSASFNV